MEVVLLDSPTTFEYSIFVDFTLILKIALHSITKISPRAFYTTLRRLQSRIYDKSDDNTIPLVKYPNEWRLYISQSILYVHRSSLYTNFIFGAENLTQNFPIEF